MKQLKTFIVASLALCFINSSAQSIQPHPCKAITKAGKPCKMPAMKGSDFCMVHNPSALRCGFIKKDGKPCQMRVVKAGEKCRFHQ